MRKYLLALFVAASLGAFAEMALAPGTTQHKNIGPRDYVTTNAWETVRQKVDDLATERAQQYASVGGVSTNAISGIITNHVDSGYLCTVDAAQSMTNNLPDWTKTATKPGYTASEVGALSASWATSSASSFSGTAASADKASWLVDYGTGTITRPENSRLYYDPGESRWVVLGMDSGSGTLAYVEDFSDDNSFLVSVVKSASITNEGAVTEAVAYADSANETTRAIVTQWESFLDGSNVVFSITNYISGTYNIGVAKLRILEMTNGVYREVYNSREEIVMHLENFKTNDFRTATNKVITAVDAKIASKAEKAWGQYTSAGGEAPSNTVYMTAPNTVFAGGMEYERVAVGEGAVCVLTTKGAPVWTQGDEGTFKFQDDGGTNYFGFAKSDSYVIGCDTDGISVSDGIVTLTYNVTMSGVPCIWYKEDISSNVAWEQLNLPDGTAIAGASHVVSWEATPAAGTEVCYINCENEPKGFFKATIEVAGSAKFMTNMPADLSGGIVCTNTATGVNGIVKPSYDGTTVNWAWSEQ